MNTKQTKKDVIRAMPNAYCVRLYNKTAYVVWECKTKPRGFEAPACGYGKTAAQAWASVQL